MSDYAKAIFRLYIHAARAYRLLGDHRAAIWNLNAAGFIRRSNMEIKRCVSSLKMK